MKQTLFETRERANELLREALEIWRQGDNSDQLDGIEKDPVFSLLMNALAYQENEIDNDISRLKQEIADDFARLMTPFEVGHAIPASAVVETMPDNSLAEVSVNKDSIFKLEGRYSFMPLFNSKVINASIGSVERLDGRRWKVEFNFSNPIKDLSGFCFATRDIDYKTLSVKIQGSKLRLIRPWNYTELPFTPYFSPDSLIYTHGEAYTGSMLPMDIFVRQNIRMFWIDEFKSSVESGEQTKLDMVFEFSGISENFIFDASKLVLNTILLVNAEEKEVSLSSQTPITRIAGYSEGNNDNISQQFLQLIRPSYNQLYSSTQLEVRRVSGDRFNQASLVKLLTSIVNKYHTDFYAFQNLDEMKSDKLLYNLQELIARMIRASKKEKLRNMGGVYLLLHNRSRMKDPSFSLNVKYLTTSGAGVNSSLKNDATFQSPANLNQTSTKQITRPVTGSDEVASETISKTLLRYYMITGDRIVTPADIKLFCMTELERIYGLSEDTIERVTVATRQSKEEYGSGYEICVDIHLNDSPIIKRSLAGRLPMIEIVLQKMLEVRSTGIYPFRVTISFT